MQHTVSFNQEFNIIETKLNGAIQSHNLYETLQKGTALSLEHNCFLWLFDYRKAIINFNSFDMAHFISVMRQATEPLKEKVQCVKRANVLPETMDDLHFFQSMSKSNLHDKRVKQFLTFQEAISWLYDVDNEQASLLTRILKKKFITIRTYIHCDLKNVWSSWNSEDSIKQWFHESEKWVTPVAIHNLYENGIFNYRIESKDGRYGHTFSGFFKRIKIETFIIYQLNDGRIHKVVFYPDNNQTILTLTFETDDINIIKHQQKSWQDILDNFKAFVECEFVKPKE